MSYIAGDVLLLRSKSFLSWIIRKLTGGDFSHCAVFISPDTLVEATFDGIYCSPLSKFLNDKTLTIEIRRAWLTQEETQSIVTFTEQQCGKKYDVLQILGLFLTTILNINKKVVLFNVVEAWTCSELVSVAFFCAGINLFDLSKVNIYNITPNDIAESGVLVPV